MKTTIVSLVFLSLFSVILYAFTMRGIVGNPDISQFKEKLDQPTKPFELSPERGRYLLTMSLARDHSFALSESLAQAAYPDVGYYNGKYYIFFAPGISLLALPLYTLGAAINMAQVGAFATIAIFALASSLLLYRISRKVFNLPNWISLVVPVTFAVGTTSLSYATTLYQHQVTTFLLLLGFYSVWSFRAAAKSKRPLIAQIAWSLVLGLSYGYAIFIDYPNAFIMLPIGIYFIISILKINKVRSSVIISFKPVALVCALVFALSIALHGYYNYVNFDSPTRVSGSLLGAKQIKESNITVADTAAIAKLAEKKDPVKFFSANNFINGFYELTIAPDKGILIFSPVLALSLFGLATALRIRRLETYVLLFTIFAIGFLYASFGDPWGGWAYGPRYLIPAMALLAIFVGTFLTGYANRIVSRVIFFLAFCMSLALSLAGALTTNAMPPQVEADYLHTHFGIQRAIDYVLDNSSSSIMYNALFATHIRLIDYFLLLFIGIMILMAGLIFVPSSVRRTQ